MTELRSPTAGDADSAQPLSGVRVLELSQAIAGPTCGRYLAAHGAEVIKIESLANPDIIRMMGAGWLPPDTPMPVRFDTGPLGAEFISGKLSAGLNLAAPEGRDIFLRLVQESDVLLTNLSAPVLPALELGYDNVVEVRPDIIYCSLPGFGNTPSRYHDFKAWGPNQAPLTGLDHMTGWPDRAPSGVGSFSYPDFINGSHAMIAIMAAVLHRDVTGEGQFIDMSQYESTVTVIGPTLLDATANGHVQGRSGNHVPDRSPNAVYPTRGSDRWVAVSCETEEQWNILCRLAEDEPFTVDRRFATLAGRKETEVELDAAIAQWTSRYTSRDLAYRLQAAGVPAGVVADQADLIVDPQLEAREFFNIKPHARFGADLCLGYPPHLSATQPQLRRAAPIFGEDNTYVIEGVAEVDHESRVDLAGRRVVFESTDPERTFKRPYVGWIRHFIRATEWPPE